MKIIKKFIKREKNFIIAGKIFDDALTTVLRIKNPFFDKMEAVFSENDSVNINLEKREAAFHFNCLNDDERELSINILRIILLAYAKLEYDDELMQEIKANRDAMKLGFSDDLFYYLYKNIASRNVMNYEDFIRANLTWLTYHNRDEFYEAFLKKTIDKMHHRKEYQSRFKKQHYIKKLAKVV